MTLSGPHQPSVTLYAEWGDIEERVKDAVESVLLDADPHDPPPCASQIAWAQETAERVVAQTMMHLDGYSPSELAGDQ